MTYRAPIKDIVYALEDVAGLNSLIERGVLQDLEQDLVHAVLEEAGKFASEKIAPLNQRGDEKGAVLVNGEVEMPDGWADVYKEWVGAGWGSLPCPKAYGGQGLPVSIAMACAEIWNSASMAFGLNPLLTQAAVHALSLYGSDKLKSLYLQKLVTGEWTGTMQLTEPHSGSDLGVLSTKAVPQGDGSFRLSGTKIFITYGEHSLSDNIIHMVLARTPDAPSGTRGLSLFLVPKFLLTGDGSPGERNDVHCSKLEHKLGIHGSPTCVMNLGENDGAVGWLIGEQNRGLQAMFAMMNEARLGVGVQGVAIGERAYQQALTYAQERKQGKAMGAAPGEMSPIIAHPDVRRMLLSMRARIAASRAICAVTANAIDVSVCGEEQLEKEKALAKASLLTPVAKAYSTDMGVEVASDAIQVHGGMGYIEETGAAQHYRDARIAPIYEGTNGIQAIDLVMRKLPMNDGQTVRDLLKEFEDNVSDVCSSNLPGFGNTGERLREALFALSEATEWMLSTNGDEPEQALASATSYCRLFGITAGGILLGKGALAASQGDNGHADYHLATARFFAEQFITDAPGLTQTVIHGAEAVTDVTVDDLLA